MRSASECREQSKECRALARGFDGERRQQTLRMAETWEDLAREVDRANSRLLWGMVKTNYDRVAQEPVPDIFRGLLERLQDAESGRQPNRDWPPLPRLGFQPIRTALLLDLRPWRHERRGVFALREPQMPFSRLSGPNWGCS